MDPNLRITQEFRLEHRHGDGSFATMREIEHDSSSHDGERSWLRRRLFRCDACSDVVAVTTGGDETVVVDEANIR
jgi:hypothetical protein